MSYILFLLLFLGGEATRTRGGGAPLLALHAATLPFALAAGGAALVEGLAALLRGPGRGLSARGGAALRAALFAPVAIALAAACLYAGASSLLGGAAALALAGAALRRLAPVDPLRPAVRFQVALRCALQPSWDAESAAFASALLLAPPLAVLLAARRLDLDGAVLARAGVHSGCAGGIALAPWAALLALYLGLGPAFLSLDGDGALARASRALLVEGRMLTWMPLVVTGAWVALLARVARGARSERGPDPPAAAATALAGS